MSTTVIFGLLVSTVLTLGVIPALYLVYGQWRNRHHARNRIVPTAVPAGAGDCIVR